MHEDFCKFSLMMCIGKENAEGCSGSAQGPTPHGAATSSRFISDPGLDQVQEYAERNFGMCSMLIGDAGSLRCGTVAESTPF